MNVIAAPIRSLSRTMPIGLLVALQACGAHSGPGGEPTAERLGDDLIAARSTVTITATIPGDAILAGGRVEFSGAAGGDYLGAGGEQRINGTVGASVRAAGGEIVLGAEVGRNASLAGGRIAVAPGAVIGENVYVAGGEIRIAGAVEGAVRALGGEVTLDGVVGDQVNVQAGRLVVGPGARIGGDLRYRVPAENVTIDPAAEIAGEAIPLPPPPGRRGWLLVRLAWHIGFLVAGAAAVLLFPRLGQRAVARLQERTGASVGFGLLWILVVPLALAALMITIIGIPLALIALAAYLISLYLARTVVALWLGRQILRGRASADRGGLALSFLAGGVVLVLAGALPYLGPLVTLVATIVGLGALVVAVTRTAPPPSRAGA